jgi:hypothetical protein
MKQQHNPANRRIEIPHSIPPAELGRGNTGKVELANGDRYLPYCQPECKIYAVNQFAGNIYDVTTTLHAMSTKTAHGFRYKETSWNNKDKSYLQLSLLAK